MGKGVYSLKVDPDAPNQPPQENVPEGAIKTEEGDLVYIEPQSNTYITAQDQQIKCDVKGCGKLVGNPGALAQHKIHAHDKKNKTQLKKLFNKPVGSLVTVRLDFGNATESLGNGNSIFGGNFIIPDGWVPEHSERISASRHESLYQVLLRREN